MNLQFIPASPEDISVIFSQSKALIDAYEDLSVIDYDRVLAWVERKITNNISSYTCVIHCGQKCAYYRLCEDGEIDDLYVLPSFQNHGIGSAILQRIITVSKAPLYLYVFSQNKRAIALYQKFGFSFREHIGATRMILHRKG